MSNPANRRSWKALPSPSLKEPLCFQATYTDAEYAAIGEGLVPREMEDKWFVYLEDEWLHIHRSWTGAEIYALRLERKNGEWRVIDSWLNREPSQYRGSDLGFDRELVRFIVDAFLLRKATTFPMPRGSDGKPEGAVHHVYVGRAYPEKPPNDA